MDKGVVRPSDLFKHLTLRNSDCASSEIGLPDFDVVSDEFVTMYVQK